MEVNIIDDILELYEVLVENGVIFFYGDESISIGEITEFNILNTEVLQIELDGSEKYEVSIEDFIEYYSKEGANYHTWPDIRKLDKKLGELSVIGN